jgi:predicted ATP-grasp superfamily ATP-dependent carboligase
MNQSKTNAAMLLTMGGYFGTLAAARCLGRRGLQVYLADADSQSPTAMSRYVTKFFATPAGERLERFGQSLLRLGEEAHGAVLYPTSDDMAWVMARRRQELAQKFKMYQPPSEVIDSLLNKKILYQTAGELGIDVPDSHYPGSFEEIEALKDVVTYPVIVKPKTQIGMSVPVKALVCRNAAELLHNARRVVESFPYLDEMLEYNPDVKWPMIQAFHPEAASETYSLGGFLTENATDIVVRGAKKVLQQPIRVGVGMAFESRPVNVDLQDQIVRLCRKVGYYGVFEAEFIHIAATDKYLLIDFNPRFYGQMGFEIARGMPLPLFVHHAATGRHSELSKEIAAAADWDHSVVHKYAFGWMMRTLLTTQWLSGRISSAFRRRWLAWSKDVNVYDAVHAEDDHAPHRAYLLNILRATIRHPRSSFYHFFR